MKSWNVAYKGTTYKFFTDGKRTMYIVPKSTEVEMKETVGATIKASSKERLLNTLDTLAAPHIRLIASVNEEMKRRSFGSSIHQDYANAKAAIETYRAAARSLLGV